MKIKTETEKKQRCDKCKSDKKSKPSDRLKACKVANDLRLAIVRLLVKGPGIIENR